MVEIVCWRCVFVFDCQCVCGCVCVYEFVSVIVKTAFKVAFTTVRMTMMTESVELDDGRDCMLVMCVCDRLFLTVCQCVCGFRYQCLTVSIPLWTKADKKEYRT